MAPPLFSTLSAITELAVTAVVVYFFHQILQHGRYRFGLMAVALLYETLFNISYMTVRLFSVGESAGSEYPSWFIAFLGVHGALSLFMFISLIVFVIWAFDRTGKGEPDPIGTRPRLAYAFLVLWGLSILSGEFIYALQWTDWVTL